MWVCLCSLNGSFSHYHNRVWPSEDDCCRCWFTPMVAHLGEGLFFYATNTQLYCCWYHEKRKAISRCEQQVAKQRHERASTLWVAPISCYTNTVIQSDTTHTHTDRVEDCALVEFVVFPHPSLWLLGSFVRSFYAIRNKATLSLSPRTRQISFKS